MNGLWLSSNVQRLRVGGKFITVGAAGLLINQVILWALVDGFHLNYLLGAVIATQGSTTFNFLGAETWVFRGRSDDRWSRLLGRFLAYDLLNSSTLLIRLPLLLFMTGLLGIHYLISNLFTLGVVVLFRFLIADGLIWRPRPIPPEADV
jgi:putative flippase GtrA